MPTVKSTNSQQGNAASVVFTIAAPAVGDLMVVGIATDTPMLVKSPVITTTNVIDGWVPIFGIQDAQSSNSSSLPLRMQGFYKTANATDAAATTFTFTFSYAPDNSGQQGVPNYSTTDYVGFMATFQSAGAGYAGFDTASPQGYQPNGALGGYALPSVNTHGGTDTFYSIIAQYGTPAVTHSDTNAVQVLSVTNSSPVNSSLPLNLQLWRSTTTGTSYPYQFNIASPGQFGDVITALVGLRDATSFYYNGPFLRMGYPYEGPDQMLITRYPYHWAYTAKITAGVVTIGQFFTQNDLANADRFYMGKTLLSPTSDFTLILNAGVGGDFNPL